MDKSDQVKILNGIIGTYYSAKFVESLLVTVFDETDRSWVKQLEKEWKL